MKILILFTGLLLSVYGYMPVEKDHYFPDLLRDVVNRMSKDLDASYMDFSEPRLPLGSRSLNLNKDLEEEQFYPLDYDALTDSGQLHPTLRDSEFLQHSTLWGSQYMSGGAGEGDQRLQPEGLVKNRQEVKSDSALPAYCNPPNPCPIGYTAENGCLEEFKNTAAFSRRYQAEQDCMCDTEHMFDCPSTMIQQLSNRNLDTPLNDLEFNRFFQQALQDASGIEHKNLVAKKFNNSKKSLKNNPFLIGERLPVAAKKGFNAKEFY